ncbi:MAG: endolytic transglycosylase MltG, partial [Candidatus Omnitrophica bacterium]|nr:endolytic transglycosylase MltG [Candidatus Omnitrophota bacterium]
MNKWIVRSLLIALLVVAFAAGLYIWSEYRAFNRPWGTEADTFTYEIPEGMGARQIASMLKEKGVIHNVNTFLVVADLRGIGGQLKAGEYEFEGTKTPYEILSMLSIGWAKRHRLVIPEGFTQLDIGKRCEEMLICTKEEFLKACHADPIFAWIVAQAPGGAAAGSEGTLFPDTYLLIKNTPGYKVYEKMRKQFETVWSELRKKIDEDGITGLWWQDNNITAREQALNVLILASIIEKEAKRDEDRPLIA